MPRLLTLIDKPLAKSSQLVLRRFYKNENNLARNTSEKKLMSEFGYASKNEMYRAFSQEYNAFAEQENGKILVERHQKRRDNERVRRATKSNAKENLKSRVVNITQPDIIKLRNALKLCKGKSVVIEYVVNKSKNTANNLQRIGRKVVVKSSHYNVPENFRQWWKNMSREWYEGNSGGEVSIFEDMKSKGNLFIYPEGEMNTTQVVQLFRDGITHCVFTPIRIWATEKLETSSAEKTKYRYSGMLKKIDKFEQQYTAGLPEDRIPEICNSLQIDISVELPFCTSKFIEAKSIMKSLRTFKFMNTRLNHVELNEVVQTGDIEIIKLKDMLELKKQLDKDNEYYTYKKNVDNVCSISTLKKTYKLSNEFSEVVSAFEIECGLNTCKIDDIDDSVLSKYIHGATNYNGTVDFKALDVENIVYGIVKEKQEIVYCELNGEEVRHIDMTKAYANFKTCKFYQGFLGKITDFRQTNKMNGVGIYTIANLQIPEGKFCNYNATLKIYMDNNAYTSAELTMLESYGATFDIVCGCWGVKSLDFEFNDDMMNKRDDNDIPYYSKWTGVCDQHKLKKTFWIKGGEDYFNVIRNSCEQGVVQWYKNNEGCISFPKKHNYHLGHIASFITAYQRMNMLEQLMELDEDNVIRVCVDGIYHTQSNVELKNVFRAKPEKKLCCELACESYVDKAHEKDLVIEGSESREHYLRELHLGAGGCGKTHYNCNDKGLVRTLFLAPSWKLARCKQKEIGMNCSVWARALSTDPQKISYIKENANVLIVDEISMLSEEEKLKFFNVYKDMKIIMCGDLGYQLPCIEGEEANNTGFDHIVKHDKNYRCTDTRLMEILTALRTMIKDGKNKQSINAWVMKRFTELGRLITIDELKKKYTVDDLILAGTNDVKDHYTSLFPTLDKFYVQENNRLYCNGDIVIGEKPIGCKSEVRHCFTTHSIQGETASHKLFVDSSKMFDSRMFYTALSRAKSLEQIYIIQNESVKFKYEFAKIYKIVSANGIYIGSTVQQLEKRFVEHKKAYEEYKTKGGKYLTSFKLLGDSDVTITKIENFRCNDIKDLWKRESEVIQTYGKKCVNKTYNEWAE